MCQHTAMPKRKKEPEARASHVVVDAIEGKYARVELPDGTTEDWSLASLPEGVKEGDVVRVQESGGDFEMEVDRAETEQRRSTAQRKLEALNQDAPTEEINL